MNPFGRYFLLLLPLSLVACAGGGTVVSGTGAPVGAEVPAEPGTSTDGTAPSAEDIVGCSFRVSGATVDKLSGSPVVASMDGSTLVLTCQTSTAASGTKVVLSASIKAFDGPGDYVLDQDAKGGELSYVGNDGAYYYSKQRSSASGRKGSCTFTFLQGPSDPKAGDTVVATFHCEGMEGYRPGSVSSSSDAVPVVEVVKGSVRAAVK